MHCYNRTPIINALAKYIDEEVIRFHMPGHKGKDLTHRSLLNLLGSKVFQADVTNVPGMDDLHQVHSVIKESQSITAQIYGADQTYFLVNGSSCGLQALIIATCNPGDKILVPRNMHRSILSGIIMSGAIPVFYLPEYDSNYKIPLGTAPDTIKSYLQHHADIKAVMLVNPTYHGITTDISAVADIVHAHNLPLLVDEAHGPHLAFHKDLPASSLSCGADATVHGSHKMLPAFTQSAMVHIKGNRINHERLEASLRILQSTSTSYLLLSSLEAAIALMVDEGEEMLQNALERSSYLREEINNLAGYATFSKDVLGKPGAFGLDLTKVTISIKDNSFTGTWAEKLLREAYNIQVEMSDLYNLLLIITAANTDSEIHCLLKALKELRRYSFASNVCVVDNIKTIDEIPKLAITPREAFMSERVPLAMEKTIGRVCAETIASYPPGIPIICPGEVITRELVDYLMAIREVGIHFQGCLDPSLRFISVVK